MCSSNYVKNGFIKNYKNKSLTITPAVNTKFFVPAAQNSPKEKIVLFVAGLHKSQQHKGLWNLLNAVKEVQKEIPDVILSIVGEGDLQPEYAEYAEKQGITNVRFQGRLG